MNHTLRRYLCLLLAALTVLTVPGLSGCSAKEVAAAETAAAYLSLWEQGDYAGMYALTLPGETGEEAFVQRYENIFGSLGIEVSCGDPVPGEGGLTFTAEVTFTQAALGEFTKTVTLPLARTKGGFLINWTPALIFPELEEGDSVRFVPLEPVRGEILASGGEALAVNTYVPTLYVIPSRVEDLSLTLTALTAYTDESYDDLLARCQAAAEEASVVIQSYPHGVPEGLEAYVEVTPGTGIDTSSYTPGREYPYGSLMAHCLGYVQRLDEDDLAKDPTVCGYFVGQSGLEQAYQQVLQGKRGAWLYTAGADGTFGATVARKDAENGLDLVLTVDLELQQRAERLMEDCYGSDRTGAVVVLDPSTGAVQAIASYPTYDVNDFVWGISTPAWEALNAKEANQPLFNRVLQGLYPPGSTFKPFTAHMGLKNDLVSTGTVFPETIVNMRWEPQFVSWHWPSIKRHSDYEGDVNLYNSMIHSDNIFFAYIALLAGEELFTDYMYSLKLNTAVPFDLTTVPGQLFVDEELGFESPRILADAGYGQGEILVTPLQLASMFSVFANEGSACRPYLVQGLYREEDNGMSYVCVEETQPELWLENVISENLLSIIHNTLKGVVAEGTGTNVRVEGKKIAGKTGTAEMAMDNSKSIAWFTGYLYDSSQERLVCVMEEADAQSNYQRIYIARELFKDDPLQQQD